MEAGKLKIINAKLEYLSDKNIKAIVEIEQHPAVRRWLTDYENEDFKTELDSYRKFFQELVNNNKVEVLVAKIDDQIVGFLALWHMEEYNEHTRSIGISVHPDYWGKGIATALIKESIKLARKIGAKKIIIETLKENYAMRHAAEKTGFKMEIIRERKVQKNGKCYDEVVYTLNL
ncbi:MAG: GNAT family N-acetyltransferase [Candidatus Bathyarchaeia archaeon]